MPSPAPIPTPVPPVDESEELFDANSLLEIEIELDPDDWDALRVQARTMADIFGEEECLSEPRTRPYTYFHGDVWVNGEPVPNVGVRKKGLLGSVNSTSPSLKISFDEFVDGRRFKGLRRMTLNNARQDPSHLRQCVTYGLFAKAGVPAPRCNFARVAVNGRDLGVYAHVESVKKPFLARHFADNDGNLYEGVLSDFRPDWVKTFERKTNKSDGDRSDLDTLVDALAADDDVLLSSLEPILDVDAFVDFWVMEVLTGHWDGYAGNRNNFYVYHDPDSDRFQFIPWGTDGAMQANFQPAPDGGPALTSVFAMAHLPRRLYLYPAAQARYLDRLDALLDTVWDEPVILAEIDRMAALIGPHLKPGIGDGFREDVAAVRSFVRTRRATIESELRAGPPTWDYPESGPPCRRTVGHFHATFAVHWERPEVVTATAEVRLGDTSLELAQVAAAAGKPGTEPWPTHPTIQVAGIAAEPVPPIWRPGDALLVILYVDPARFGTPGTVAIDGTDAFGWAILALLNEDGTRRPALMGFVWGGELMLDESGTDVGDPVSGTIDADIAVWGG